MQTRLARLSFAALISGVLGFALVPAVAAWHFNPPTCSNATGVCVAYDDNQGEPRAVNSISDNSWSGHDYPNTNTPIDNTVSSVRNGFASDDILFYEGYTATGDSFCLEAGFQINDLGWWGGGFDDSLSSHVIQPDWYCS